MKIRMPLNVLMIDDDPGDIFLTRETLAESRLFVNLYDVTTGPDALAFLRREGKFAGEPEPDVILLDLNLPGMSGREVLQFIKKDERLKKIPVVIFSTSTSEQDIGWAYGLGANSYIYKPIDLDAFVKVVKDIGEFWMKVVSLPEKC